jgi:hypothetical protein
MTGISALFILCSYRSCKCPISYPGESMFAGPTARRATVQERSGPLIR